MKRFIHVVFLCRADLNACVAVWRSTCTNWYYGPAREPAERRLLRVHVHAAQTKTLVTASGYAHQSISESYSSQTCCAHQGLSLGSSPETVGRAVGVGTRDPDYKSHRLQHAMSRRAVRQSISLHPSFQFWLSN